MQSRVLAVLSAVIVLAGCDRLYGRAPGASGDDDDGHPDAAGSDGPGPSSGCSTMGMLTNDLTTGSNRSAWWSASSEAGNVDFSFTGGDAALEFFGGGSATPASVVMRMNAALDLRDDSFAVRFQSQDLPVGARISLDLVDARGRVLGIRMTTPGMIQAHASFDIGDDIVVKDKVPWKLADDPVWRISFVDHAVHFATGSDSTTVEFASSTQPMWVSFVRAVIRVDATDANAFTATIHPLDGATPDIHPCPISMLMDSFDARSSLWEQNGTVTFDGAATMHETPGDNLGASLVSTTVYDMTTGSIAAITPTHITDNSAFMRFQVHPIDPAVSGDLTWEQRDTGSSAMYNHVPIDVPVTASLGWGIHLDNMIVHFDQSPNGTAWSTARQADLSVSPTGTTGYDRVTVEIGALPSGTAAPNDELQVDRIGSE